MARILYGVAGEGSGHSSRAKIITEHLLKKGHEVKLLSHDKGYENLSHYFPVEKIAGLRITYKNNEVQYLKTALETLKKLPSTTRSLNKILSLVQSFKPDSIITDFEPLTAMAAGIALVPLLSIDNQHIMTGTAVESPRGSANQKIIIKNVVRYLIPPADAYYVTTFFYPRVTDRKVKLFPPLIRDEVLQLTPATGNYLLVYTTAENNSLMDTLEKIKIPCIIYGASKPRDLKNEFLQYKPHQVEGFMNDLANCKAVIATAGLSLMSEALSLHKPYFALPVDKQFEQLLNGYYLKKLDYGDYSLNVTTKQIRHFLHKTEHYRNKLSSFIRTDNHEILDALDNFIAQYTVKH